MHARKTPRIHGKNRQLHTSIGFSTYISENLWVNVVSCKRRKKILTFLHFPDIQSFEESILVSHQMGLTTQKKKENVQNDDCKYIAMEILFASLQDRFEEINVSVDT